MEDLDKIVETTERIVIHYANLSGRETANRAEFRKKVMEELRHFTADILRVKN